MTDDETVDLLPFLDEFHAMGETGLSYAEDPYDEERDEHMLELVAEHYGETFSLPPAEKITGSHETRDVKYLPVDEVPEWTLNCYEQAIRDARGGHRN